MLTDHGGIGEVARKGRFGDFATVPAEKGLRNGRAAIEFMESWTFRQGPS